MQIKLHAHFGTKDTVQIEHYNKLAGLPILSALIDEHLRKLVK